MILLPVVFSSARIWLLLIGSFPALWGMSLDDGLRFSHLVDVICRESWSCIKVTHIYGFYPCILYWAKCLHMRVIDGIFLPLTWYMYFIWFVGLSKIWRGTLHKPVITSLVPWNSTCSYLVTAMLCWLNLASHTVSLNLPMDTRDHCSNHGRKCASLDSSGKVVNSSRQTLVECRILSFGCFTWISVTSRDASSWGASAFS